jgi:glycosyltransferase involved in cell wall biosynthesis
VTRPTFRVKPYAHPKYKFVVRAKLAGKWKRSYFKTEAEAVAYADNQNASLEKQLKQPQSGRSRSDEHTNGTGNWHELEKSNRRSTVSSQAVSRKVIVVLGMHRSGTSALCGALNVLGVNFGQRLAPAAKDNEKGYWEHPEIVALHDELLRSLGSRWDNDRPLPSDWVERDITRDIQSLLLSILERDFAHASLFGLKDPRMCRLMPLWLPIFQTLQIEPHFVLTVRHPWEVAESLAKRDGLEHPKSYLLWLEHLVQAISATRGYRQSVVCYEEMMDNPVKVLTGLRKELGVNLRAPFRVRTSLHKFLEPSLRHHHLKKGQANKCKPPVPHLVLDIYETIRNASTSVEIGEKTAPLVAQFSRGSELFYPRVNLVEAELGSLDKEIAKSEETGMGSEGLVRLEVFHPVAEGYRATESQTRYFASRSWKVLVIDLPGKKRNLDWPLRIDPVSYPAVIDIAEIALKRPSTGEILWAATGSKEFAALTVGGTACRSAHESYLRILSFGNDPQLLLPQSTTALGDAPLRLELSILVDPSPQAISASLAENEEHVRNIEQQTNVAEAEIRDLKTSVQSERIQLAAKRSQTAELTDKLLKLDQNVKNFAQVFGLTRQGLQDSGSAAAVLIQSLFHDIRQIRKSKSLWKACRLFRSTLSREGTHDIPSNPKVTAEVLKQRLRGIQRTLKSKKTSPAMALNAMAEFIALQNQVHQVLASLKVRSLLRLQQKTVTTGEPVSHLPASKFSPLFDTDWYLEKNPDVKKLGMDPLQHYLRYGAQEGRDPHPLFDAKWYSSQKPELPKVGLTPLEHYVSYGAREGCSPHPEFDSQFYIKNHPESVLGDMTPLAHYLTVGWRLGDRPNPRFDPHFYLRAYPDVAAANIEPLTHFVLQGRTEGRKTTEEKFSFEAYRPAFDIPREPIVSADPSLVPTVKAIAFYLPQFHPIPENDRWWGKGFTDWNNVRAGRSNFPGHYQPHVPIGLGYYDLRETQVLQKQTELAKAYGIYGFCFYYYWFDGKVLLDLPIRRMLESGKPDFPFCICWANENWTRRWDGREDDVLIAQSHSPEDDVNFIRRVENALLQKNYIRVRGKPLLLVYRPSLFPDSLATTERWRDYFRRKGHGELHLVMIRSFHDQTAPEVYGFDAAVQFPPHFPTPTITSLIAGKEEKFKGTIYDYTDLRSLALEQLITASSTGKTYAAVVPSWDNTARRGSHAAIFANSSPEAYYEWLSATVEQVQKKEEADERLIFINAWNEWAEGAHLEPDERYRYAWLNATRLALEAGSSRRDVAGKSDEPYVLVISHDAALAGAQVLLLNLLRRWKKRRPFAVRVICVGTGELRKEFEKCFPTLVLADFAVKAEQDYALAEFLKGSPRVIYSSTVANGPLLAQLRPLGAKIVTHAHELQKSIERWAPGEIMAETLKHSDFFLAASPKIAENLSISHGVPKDHLHVVYAFIEPWTEEQEPTAAAKAAMQEELGIAVEDVVVFGCGTTDWRKGPDLFVEIARSACARDSRLKFLWIGGDPVPFMEKVRSAGLEGRVFFVGHRKEARRYYYAGHIFLLSSREDPCPLVALEAANAGLPIVCFADAGDIPGFVGEECGVVVPYEDVPAAARAVLRLAGDAELRRSQGAEGRRRIVERHSSDSAASQIEALFDRLVYESQPVPARIRPGKQESLVSVIVPNYNHEKYLPERLRSITGQTYENMEIILLDDASTDNSRAILQNFSSEERRAHFIPNTQNSGSTFKQWRKGLSHARGKYVWVAESDDAAEPAFLETLVDKLEANPGLSLAYCQLQMMSLNGEKLGTPEEPWLSEIDPLRWNTDFVNDGIDEIRRSLVVKNTMLNASSVVFRNAEGIADLVDDSMRFCADWLFWVRLLQRGGVAYIAKPLSQWRIHSSNARKRPPGELEWLEGERVLLEAIEILKMTPPERDRILLDFLRKCWKWRIEAVPLERESAPKK